MKKISEKISRIPNFVWIAVCCVAAVLDGVRRILLGNECAMKQLFGIPCPVCGMTRAYFSLFTLNFSDAFHYNPAFWTFPVSVLACIMAFADKKRARLWLAVFALMLAVLLCVWIFRIATKTTV